jgi:hypothetical protein
MYSVSRDVRNYASHDMTELEMSKYSADSMQSNAVRMYTTLHYTTTLSATPL